MNRTAIRWTFLRLYKAFVKSLSLFITLSLLKLSAAQINVPMERGQWKLLTFRKIRPNQVEFKNGNLVITIDKSASPIIYTLNTPMAVKEIEVSVKIDGLLKLDQDLQGSKSNDDFRFRLGLVYVGEKTLNSFQRLFAPKWVRTLYELAPKEKGIDHVHFFNTWSDVRIKGKERTHPASDLLRESFVLEVESDGTLRQKISPNPNKKIAALWVSSDGDDTGSKFKVTIGKIVLRDND